MIIRFAVGQAFVLEMFTTAKWLSASCAAEMLETNVDVSIETGRSIEPRRAIVSREHWSLDRRLNVDKHHTQVDQVYADNLDSIMNHVLLARSRPNPTYVNARYFFSWWFQWDLYYEPAGCTLKVIGMMRLPLIFQALMIDTLPREDEGSWFYHRWTLIIVNLLAGRAHLLRDIGIFRFLLAIALSAQGSTTNEDLQTDSMRVESVPVVILGKTDLQ